jgi:hypothetical protein
MYKKICLINLIFFTLPALATNKIIYFISPPRSLSVAFMRMMQTRSDFQVMHEPSQKVFCLNFAPDKAEQWYRNDAPSSYEQVIAATYKKAQQGNVFVKEMSFALEDLIIHNKEFVQDPNVYFVFLTRNPHHNAISFYKRIKPADHSMLDPMFSTLIGHRAAYNVFSFVKKFAIHKPLIICTEDLINNPEQTVRGFCEKVGIPFKPEAMTWQDLGDQFDGISEWSELKNPGATQHWHGNAIHSTGFGRPSHYNVDQQGNPTFSEISSDMHRAMVQKAYEENLAYYNLLIQEKEYLLVNDPAR